MLPHTGQATLFVTAICVLEITLAVKRKSWARDAPRWQQYTMSLANNGAEDIFFGTAEYHKVKALLTQA